MSVKTEFEQSIGMVQEFLAALHMCGLSEIDILFLSSDVERYLQDNCKNSYMLKLYSEYTEYASKLSQTQDATEIRIYLLLIDLIEIELKQCIAKEFGV